MMTKNNSINKLESNYEQTNASLLSSQRKRRSKSQVTSNNSQDASVNNGIEPRNSMRKKKSCETPASPDKQDIAVVLSSTETTTDSTSTICKEKFLDKLDLHVKPKVKKISRRFTCDFCDQEFLTQSYLNLHVFRVHKDILTFKQIKVSNNKSKSTLMRNKFNSYAVLRHRYETTNTQLNKFNPRFVSKISDERKKRRKLFRKQIQMNTRSKSKNVACKKASEVEDKSNLQVPTSTVEIDESSKDNTVNNPTSTSEINEYKSKSKRIINKFKDFVLSNGNVIDLSDIKEDNDDEDSKESSSDESVTHELPDKKSKQRKVSNNSKKLNTSDNPSESLPMPTFVKPEILRQYFRKKDPKANKKNTKDHGYCDSCIRSLTKMDTRYQTDSNGTRKIHCIFCAHKFVSVNGIFRHVALYHLHCTCVRTKCHWYTPVTTDSNQLNNSGASKTYHCNYCLKDYDDYKKFNYHTFSFHEIEPVSDELVEKTPKYFKDVDAETSVKSWVSSACKTNFFGKKLNNGENDDDILLPIVCQKCGELYFNNKEYVHHLDKCYYQSDLQSITPITQYPKESRPVLELRESSLKPESNRKIDFVVRPNIKLQFFPQDVKTKPRNPRKADRNYDLLRRTCRRCNTPFSSVKELSIHYQDVHKDSANNNNTDNNKNNNTNTKVNGNEKTPSGTVKTKKDFDDENNITYYNYKNQPWYGHNVRHKWQCVHCKLSFKIFRAFSNHLFFEHNDESLIHICENCDEILTNLDQINKHLCVNVTAWTCKLCDKKFESGMEFRSHNTKHHYELFEPSVCLACGKKFLTHYMLMRHVKNKKCSSEKVIDELISTYSKKSSKINPSGKKKKGQILDEDLIIILDSDDDRIEKKQEENIEGAADGNFETVDCTDNSVYEWLQDEDSRKTDILATPDVSVGKKVEEVSNKVEEKKIEALRTEDETIKESIEETTNDSDIDIPDEGGIDDIPMDDDSALENTNDEDSDDGSGDDDDEEDDEDLDEEDLDDEELDEEEFDDDESVDSRDSDDLKTNDNESKYDELVKIKDDCSKIIDLNEDTYDELEEIKNYVLDNDKKSMDSGTKRKRTDDSLVDKKKKLINIHDTFTAQVDELNDRRKASGSKSTNTSQKAAGQINRCSMCKLQFSSMTLLSHHFNRVHTSAVEICQLCYKMYMTGNLVKHLVKDHYRSETDLADALVVTKDEISIERDTRDFISIIGKAHLFALCKYQEPPQASSDESVDCSDCSLTFENSDKYRIHNVEVHDKFCALCITKYRNGQEAAKHKLDAHGSTACYVWFASKMINAIGDTDTFKEAVGLKTKKRKPKSTDEVNTKRKKDIINSKSININVSSNINIDSNVNIKMINSVGVEQEDITLKDKILDILRKSQPTLDRLNSQIQSRTHQPEIEKQINNEPQIMRQFPRRNKLHETSIKSQDQETSKTMTKSPVKADQTVKLNRNQMKTEARQSSALNQTAIENEKAEKLSVPSRVIITIGSLPKDGLDNDEDEQQVMIVLDTDELRKYKNNLRELAEQYMPSLNISIEELIQKLQTEVNQL